MDNIIKSNNEIFESCAKTAANIIMYFQDDARQSMLKQLRQEVEKLCQMEERLKYAKKISDDDLTSTYYPEADNENEQCDHVEEYKKQLLQIAPDATKNKNMIEFERIVKALEDAERNDGDGNDSDDAELQLTRDTVNLIDPVTKKRMTDPVRNTICGHIYDRDSVSALLRQNPHTLCPVPGCKYKEYLSMNNMKSDIVTKTYLDKNPA